MPQDAYLDLVLPMIDNTIRRQQLFDAAPDALVQRALRRYQRANRSKKGPLQEGETLFKVGSHASTKLVLDVIGADLAIQPVQLTLCCLGAWE